MSEKERAEFEASYKIKHSMATTIRLASGRYYSALVESAWQGWQASAARYQSRIAELEAEVVRLQSDEDRINWLEFEAQDSMSGISAKFMKKQDAHPLKPGYRIYRYHKVHNAAPTLREAIDEAMKGGTNDN